MFCSRQLWLTSSAVQECGCNNPNDHSSLISIQEHNNQPIFYTGIGSRLCGAECVYVCRCLCNLECEITPLKRTRAKRDWCTWEWQTVWCRHAHLHEFTTFMITNCEVVLTCCLCHTLCCVLEVSVIFQVYCCSCYSYYCYCCCCSCCCCCCCCWVVIWIHWSVLAWSFVTIVMTFSMERLDVEIASWGVKFVLQWSAYCEVAIQIFVLFSCASDIIRYGGKDV